MTKLHLKQDTIHDTIYNLVARVKPFDALEQIHITETLAWISSGLPIFRLHKPDSPPKHLVSYFVLFDEAALKILLVDHKKAQLWLPPGGHVEIDESPFDAVKRECLEELQIHADFWCEEPVFITSTVTVGLTAGHTDVSLWYVLRGNYQHNYIFDRDEFNDIKWFAIDEIPFERTDPHMQRFIHKLKGML